jgi:hypothetical protein
LNTTHGEYYSLTEDAQLGIWLARVMTGLRFRVQFPVPVLGDNKSAEQTASVPETKYAPNTNLREHWIRSVMRFGDLTLAHIPSAWNVANIYAKALPAADFENKFVELLLLGIHNINYQSKILNALRDVWGGSHQRDLVMKRAADALGESQAVSFSSFFFKEIRSAIHCAAAALRPWEWAWAVGRSRLTPRTMSCKSMA